MFTFIDNFSGGDIGAKNATLTIFCGGSEDTINSLNPIFSVIGKSINYCGLAGSGQHTKMCNQILIASTMIGVCESLLYAHKAGLNVDNAIKAVSGGFFNFYSFIYILLVLLLVGV